MNIVIDIPEEEYEKMKWTSVKNGAKDEIDYMRELILSGTPFADKCKECGRSKSVIERVEEELRDVIDMYTCPKCQEVFRCSDDDVDIIVTAQHENLYKCPRCGYLIAKKK